MIVTALEYLRGYDYMKEIFLPNQDYCLYISGLGFIITAAMVFPLARIKEETIPWMYLALFSLLYGLSEWFGSLALGFGSYRIFPTVRVALIALSFLNLLEFGVRNCGDKQKGAGKVDTRALDGPGPWRGDFRP